MKNIIGYFQKGDELHPDPKWTEVVVKVFETCCCGEFLEDIAAELNRTGMPSS